MTIRICKKLCNECPFSNKSFKGFVADYSLQNIMSYMQTDTLFPCHKTITSKTDESVKLTNEKVKNGTYKLCRGYVESMIKSCNCPKDPELKKILLEVRSDLSDDSMSIFQFKTHHKL